MLIKENKTVFSIEISRKSINETSKWLKKDIENGQQWFVDNSKCYRQFVLRGGWRMLIKLDQVSKNDQNEVSPKMTEKKTFITEDVFAADIYCD